MIFMSFWSLMFLNIKLTFTIFAPAFQVDEDFIAAYQANYGFTETGEPLPPEELAKKQEEANEAVDKVLSTHCLYSMKIHTLSETICKNKQIKIKILFHFQLCNHKAMKIPRSHLLVSIY